MFWIGQWRPSQRIAWRGWDGCGGGKSGVQLDVVYWLLMGQFTHTARAFRTGCRRQTPRAWTTGRPQSWRSPGCRCRGWCSWENGRGYQPVMLMSSQLYVNKEYAAMNLCVCVCRSCSPADVDAQVSTDAARLGVSRVGLTQHHPDQLHNVLTLPHLKHTSAQHIVSWVKLQSGDTLLCIEEWEEELTDRHFEKHV